MNQSEGSLLAELILAGGNRYGKQKRLPNSFAYFFNTGFSSASFANMTLYADALYSGRWLHPPVPRSSISTAFPLPTAVLCDEDHTASARLRQSFPILNECSSTVAVLVGRVVPPPASANTGRTALYIPNSGQHQQLSFLCFPTSLVAYHRKTSNSTDLPQTPLSSSDPSSIMTLRFWKSMIS